MNKNMLEFGLRGILGKLFSLERIFLLIILMFFSLISSYFDWPIIFTVVFLIAGFCVLILLIPRLLNLSRFYYRILFILLIFHIIVTILSFSFHYMEAGLIEGSSVFNPKFLDAIYFSVTTFTTLGYGDFQPSPEMRIVTSIEVLLGFFSMTIAISLIWLWCNEKIIPAEMALFDANRISKKGLSVSRVRTRSILGKSIDLNSKGWFPTNEIGDEFFYNEYSQEWVKVTENIVVPENSLVIGLYREEEKRREED